MASAEATNKRRASPSSAAAPSGEEPPAKRQQGEAAEAGAGAAAGSWQALAEGGVHYRDYGPSRPCGRIVGFDMDWTLIRTKSGKTFAQNNNDWELWHQSVPTKLQQFAKEGAKIVVFTNQLGVAKGKAVLKDIQEKLDKLQASFNVPMVAMVMVSDNAFRKPRVGAWEFVERRLNCGMQIDRATSLFVGDGAGRVPPVVVKKDFGDSDLTFALNLGVPFQTPEECFLGKKQSYGTSFGFDPRQLGQGPDVPLPIGPRAGGGAEVIVAIGAPGSGKSSLCRRAFPGYVRVNRDTLKTAAKCQEAAAAALARGQACIIDNQSKAKSDRAPYIALAKKKGVPCRAVRIDVPKDACFHFNEFRVLNTESKEHRSEKVPSMIIHSFYKSVEEPTVAEGFAEVHKMGLEHLKLEGSEGEVKLLRSFLG